MIVIIGCGILGRHLLQEMPQTEERVLAVTYQSRFPAHLQQNHTNHLQCDIRSAEDLHRLRTFCGNEKLTVFYLAAQHNIDAVFSDPESARKINVDGLQNFLSCGLNIDKLFFASTDCVYGNNSALFPEFPEDAPLCPVNEYGRQKIEAENLIRKFGFTVTRLPFMFGPSLGEKQNFYDVCLQKLKNGETIQMIDGMRRSVISFRIAAQLLWRLSDTQTPPAETLNVCGDRGYSKFEVGCLLADKIGCPRTLVQKVPQQENGRFFSDQRAESACMSNAKLKQLLHIQDIPLEV